MQDSCNPSKLHEGRPTQSSDTHLYELVRLRNFQSLLRRAETKHPRVILEDLLKAEVLSSQLLLAVEDLVKNVQGMMGKQRIDAENQGMSSATEDESIKSFRSALMQSANALDGLTKLKISEKDMKYTRMKILENSSAIVSKHHGKNGSDEKHSCSVVPQSCDSESGTEKSSSVSTRDFSSSQSELTPSEQVDMSGGEGSEGITDITELQDAVLTLRDEISELQRKHEIQFMTFASNIIDIEQDPTPNTLKVLERILQKLSPQGHGWAFHERLDEDDMEQLFYFVLLQKTLKACQAQMNSIDQIRNQNMDIEIIDESKNKYDESQKLCRMCRHELTSNDDGRYYGGVYESKINNTEFLDIPKLQLQYNSSDSNEEQTKDLKKETLKRPHDFADEQLHKKRKRGSSLLSCFGGKWIKNKRSKKKAKNTKQ